MSFPAALSGFSYPIGVELRVVQVSEQVPGARGVFRWVDPNEVNGEQPDDDKTGSNNDARASQDHPSGSPSIDQGPVQVILMGRV